MAEDALGVSGVRVRFVRLTSDGLRHHDALAFLEQVRVVCATCNNGWMNGLEEGVRPFLPRLITGSVTVLDEVEQRALAAWSLKTMLMYQHTHSPRDQVVIPAEDYVAFHEAREPSPHMLARIAFMDYPSDSSVPIVDTLGQGYADVNKPGRAWINTLKIGCLVVQVIRAPSTEPGMRLQPFPRDPLFHPIWPATAFLGWPLRFAIPYNHMSALAHPDDFVLPVLPL